MNRNLVAIFLFMLLLLLSFGPQLKIVGREVGTSRLTHAVVSLLGFALYWKNRTKSLSTQLCILVFPFVSTLFLISCHHLNSTFFLSYSVAGIMTFFSSYYVLRVSHRYRLNVMFLLWMVGFVHGVIMILAFFVLPFREILYSFVVISDMAQRLLGYNLRTSGLMFASFSILSTIMSLFFALGLFFREEILTSLKNRYFFYFGQLILIGSVFSSGRTGLINVMIALLMYVFQKWLNNERFLFWKPFFKFTLFCLLVAFCLNTFVDFSKYNEFSRWSLELLNNYLSHGSLKTNSTDSLIQKQYFLPESVFGLMFGYGMSWERLGSDVGFVQGIFEIGLVGLFPFLFAQMFFIFSVLKRFGPRSNISFFFLFYFFVSFIGNFKDLYFFFLNGYSVVLFIAFQRFMNFSTKMSFNIPPRRTHTGISRNLPMLDLKLTLAKSFRPPGDPSREGERMPYPRA